MDELKRRFEKIRVWAQQGVRAPHKPLLLLYSLGQLQAGHSRLIPFEKLEKPLKELLQEFGPPRKSYHPEFPFWHLQSDGLWEVPGAEALPRRGGSNNATARTLREMGATGGFPEEVFLALKENPELVSMVARDVLHRSFPDSYHEDLLTAVGLDLPDPAEPTAQHTRRIRDPEFRERVLRAYGRQCCVCGFSVRLGSSLVGVEAAHIRWHQAGGPDVEGNGLCLCSLHHKLFDRGVWGFDGERRILISEDATGAGLEDWLLRFRHQPLQSPQRSDYLPMETSREWHVAEVLRQPFG